MSSVNALCLTANLFVCTGSLRLPAGSVKWRWTSWIIFWLQIYPDLLWKKSLPHLHSTYSLLVLDQNLSPISRIARMTWSDQTQDCTNLFKDSAHWRKALDEEVVEKDRNGAANVDDQPKISWLYQRRHICQNRFTWMDAKVSALLLICTICNSTTCKWRNYINVKCNQEFLFTF